MDLEKLKNLDALLHQNGYSDDVFAGILPYVQLYVTTRTGLRELPLRDVASSLVMIAGGKR
ncbi:MAG TPA: hypothetical protein VKX96_14420 [Chloroflexota bacterium]|nr:hypothetical protein [Chloroflexota bacterium]